MTMQFNSKLVQLYAFVCNIFALACSIAVGWIERTFRGRGAHRRLKIFSFFWKSTAVKDC
jgi:hypothetical protein